MNNANKWALWATVIGSMGIGLLACSSDSLWIDEAWVGLLASQKTLGSWWYSLREVSGSTLQMPLYAFYIWAWEKFAGHSEWALRAANIPWFCLSQCALVIALRHRRHARWIAPLLAAANPFLWFYLNEARPYIMQYAAAAVVCSVLARTAEDASFGGRPAALWILGGGLIVLSASSLLGVVWAAFAGVAWWYLVQGHLAKLRERKVLLPAAFCAISLLGLAGYYYWTIRIGARASATGRSGPWNVVYVAYELLVLAGLGPGRLQIRDHGLTAFTDLRGVLVPLTSASALFVGLLVYAARITPKNQYRRAAIAGCVYAIPPAMLLFALGFMHNFRVLGRHFTPFLPIIIGLFTVAVANVWFRSRRLGIAFFSALIVFWLTSSFSLRFGERHRKDDYRGAAFTAREALSQGHQIWWAADLGGARYYGLPVTPSTVAFTPVLNASTEALTKLPPPDMVISSKADLYDANGALAAYLAAGKFQVVRKLPAFTIWQR